MFKYSNLNSLALALIASAGVGAAASAGVMSPPAYSGMGATYGCWTFPTPSTPAPPDPGSFNPFGISSMTTVGPAVWAPASANKNGVWQLGVDPAGGAGLLDFRIANMEDLMKQKEVTIEVKYFGPLGATFPKPVISGTGFGAAGGPLHITGFSARTADNSPDWTIGTWIGNFDHCPVFESIQVAADGGASAPTSIDWVCISTNCVPTPGAGFFLSASGLMLGIRRQRRT